MKHYKLLFNSLKKLSIAIHGSFVSLFLLSIYFLGFEGALFYLIHASLFFTENQAFEKWRYNLKL